MKTNSTYIELFKDFPELQSGDVILQKEMLAHFGLLFSSYALLETSLQNCYIFWNLQKLILSGKIKSQVDFNKSHEQSEEKAFASTFGTLLKLLSKCTELKPYLENLYSLKKKRDFLVHHFFREENAKMHSDASILRLIYGMGKLRKEVENFESITGEISIKLMSKLFPEKDIEEGISKLYNKFMTELKSESNNDFGWNSYK